MVLLGLSMLSISPPGSHISCPSTQHGEQHELRSGPFSASLQGPRAQQVCTALGKGNTKAVHVAVLVLPCPSLLLGEGFCPLQHFGAISRPILIA